MINLNFYQTEESAGSKYCSCCNKEMLDGSISIMTFGPPKRLTQIVICTDCLRALKTQTSYAPKDGDKYLNQLYLESPERNQLDRYQGNSAARMICQNGGM